MVPEILAFRAKCTVLTVQGFVAEYIKSASLIDNRWKRKQIAMCGHGGK
jgi:hypothetical protein